MTAPTIVLGSTSLATTLDAKADRTELPNMGTFINDYRNDANDPNNLVSLGRSFNYTTPDGLLVTEPLSSTLTLNTAGLRTALSNKANTSAIPNVSEFINDVTNMAGSNLITLNKTGQSLGIGYQTLVTTLDAKANRTELPNLGTFINDYRNDINDPNNLVSLGRSFNYMTPDGALLTEPYSSTITINTNGLRSALIGKAPTNNPTFTGTVSGITKAMVGLENVDNTSDASKPISTATQTALNTKADFYNPTLVGTTTTSNLSVTGDITIQNNGFGYGRINGVDEYHAIILRGDISYSAPSYTPNWEDIMTFVEYSGIFRFREVNTTRQNLLLEISPTNLLYKGQSVAYKPWVVARATARTGTTGAVTLTNQQGSKTATCAKTALGTYRFTFASHPLGTAYCTFANIVGATAGFATVNTVTSTTVDVITLNQAGTAVDTLSFFVQVML